MTPKQREVLHHSDVSVAIETEVCQSAERKGISSFEKRSGAYRKKRRQNELSYVAACGLKERNVDGDTERIVVNRRRMMRSIVDKTNVDVYDGREGREERRQR
jgi:hypothetical protein